MDNISAYNDEIGKKYKFFIKIKQQYPELDF